MPGAPWAAALEVEGDEPLVDKRLHVLAGCADGEEGLGGERFGGCLAVPLQDGHQHPSGRIKEVETAVACHKAERTASTGGPLVTKVTRSRIYRIKSTNQ